MTNKTPWWDKTDITYAASTRGSIEQIAIFSMLSIALQENLCVYEHSKDGNLLCSPAEFLDEIAKLNGKIISRSLDDVKDMKFETADHVIAWNDGILTLSFDANDWLYLKAASLNNELLTSIRDLSSKYITQKTKGKAYVFVSSESGPELRQISGKAGIELERGNYTPEVLDDFDHIVRDLQSPTPCAKLIIADGEPGTGKTYLVRGITNAVDGATFVLVPPGMISDMMSPQFIPVLMDHHRDGGPIVFVIEDADSCLVAREGDNMNSISTLLNLGAGMFGDLFDVRVIATTNARKIDMDKAITRHGRCCRYIEAGALPKEQAEEVFKRLVNDNTKTLTDNQKTYTLADIYYAAYNEKEVKEVKTTAVKEKRRVGF